MADLSNHVVLVTGATAGMGEAIARRFVKEGARVVLTGRRDDRLRALAEELGERTLAVPLDVRDRAAVNAAIAGLPADFAEVDILVNNAGLALGLDGAAESEMDDWEVMVDTNVKGVLYCSRALLPGCHDSGRSVFAFRQSAPSTVRLASTSPSQCRSGQRGSLRPPLLGCGHRDSGGPEVQEVPRNRRLRHVRARDGPRKSHARFP